MEQLVKELKDLKVAKGQIEVEMERKAEQVFSEYYKQITDIQDKIRKICEDLGYRMEDNGYALRIRDENYEETIFEDDNIL